MACGLILGMFILGRTCSMKGEVNLDLTIYPLFWQDW